MKTHHLLSTFHYLPDNSATGGGKQHGEHAQGLVQTIPDQIRGHLLATVCVRVCVCCTNKHWTFFTSFDDCQQQQQQQQEASL